MIAPLIQLEEPPHHLAEERRFEPYKAHRGHMENETFRKGMTVWLKEPGAKVETAAVVKSANHKQGTVMVEFIDRAYCDRRVKTEVVSQDELRKRVLPYW